MAATLAVALVSFVSPSVSVAETATWQIVPSPSAGGSSLLTSAACTTASDCSVVGDFRPTPGRVETLAEHYDGREWSVVKSPSPTSAEQSELSGVACASANSCWAVGETRTGIEGALQTLIEHYDGETWEEVKSPNPSATKDGLKAITCATAGDCWAVGYNENGQVQPLIEHYDGSGWSVAISPAVAGAATLRGVSCTGSSDCWAVGHKVTVCPSDPTKSGCYTTLAEHYDGREWSVAETPNPDPSVNEFHAVSCVTSNYCIAVGQAGGALIEEYNGSEWSVVSNTNEGQELNGVSCATTKFCVAAGNSPSGTLVEHYSGGAWTTVPTPNAGTIASYNHLQAVTCTSGCFAVGGVETSGTLIEQYGPLPTVTALSPTVGPPAGGNSVTITGSGFEEVSAVNFGAAEAKSFTVNSPTSITAVAPPGVGTVDVIVTTSAGTTGSGPADRYTYGTLPLLGRCVNVGSSGGYESSSCVTVSPAHTGAYEWLSGPGAKPAFGGWISGAILETTGKVQIVCSAGTLSGQWTGAKTAQANLVLKGCANPASTASCQSSSSAASEIKTEAPLEAELGFIRGGSRPKVGLDLKAKGSSGTVLSFSCGALSEEQWTLEGSVIGRIKGLDIMKASLSLTYAALGGKQVPERFEGGVKETLIATRISTSGKRSEQTGLTLLGVEKPYFILRNSEKLEIKAK